MPQNDERFSPQALWSVGFFKKVDIFMAVITLMWIVITVWCAFSSASSTSLEPVNRVGLEIDHWGMTLTSLGMVACCLIMWSVLLIYRCMSFVLQIRASVETMPTEAARIAVTFFRKSE